MKPKTQQVEKITTTVDGRSFVSYRVVQEIDGVKVASEAYDDEALVLKKLFKDQGELYEQIFGVSREDARRAGWHPNHCNFSVECSGWVKFLKDEGKIEKQVQVETISVEDFVRNIVQFYVLYGKEADMVIENSDVGSMTFENKEEAETTDAYLGIGYSPCKGTELRISHL